MNHHQDGLPTTPLLLLATALLLFCVGGGLVGYIAGERQGEQRAAAIIDVAGIQWNAHRGDATERLNGAIGDAAARLENAVGDLRAQVPMYHGCGAICNAIAYQFGEVLLRARDAIKEVKVAPALGWADVLREGGIAIDGTSGAAAGLDSAWPKAIVLGLVALLCATVTLCFGLACFTILKLRASAERA